MNVHTKKNTFSTFTFQQTKQLNDGLQHTRAIHRAKGWEKVFAGTRQIATKREKVLPFQDLLLTEAVFLSIAPVPSLTATGEVKPKWDIFLWRSLFNSNTFLLQRVYLCCTLSKRVQLCQSTGLFATKNKAQTPLKPEGPKHYVGLPHLRLEAQTSYRLATENIDILASNGYKKGVCEVEGSIDSGGREKIAPTSVGGRRTLLKYYLNWENWIKKGSQDPVQGDLLKPKRKRGGGFPHWHAFVLQCTSITKRVCVVSVPHKYAVNLSTVILRPHRPNASLVQDQWFRWTQHSNEIGPRLPQSKYNSTTL